MASRDFEIRYGPLYVARSNMKPVFSGVANYLAILLTSRLIDIGLEVVFRGDTHKKHGIHIIFWPTIGLKIFYRHTVRSQNFRLSEWKYYWRKFILCR